MTRGKVGEGVPDVSRIDFEEPVVSKLQPPPFAVPGNEPVAENLDKMSVPPAPPFVGEAYPGSLGSLLHSHLNNYESNEPKSFEHS